MATLEEELSGKFGRPIKKEDVCLGRGTVQAMCEANDELIDHQSLLNIIDGSCHIIRSCYIIIQYIS